MNLGDINWGMIGALGQWFAGFATLAAVLVALQLRKPKLLTNAFYLSPTDINSVYFFEITNTWYYPIGIQSVFFIVDSKEISPTHNLVISDEQQRISLPYKLNVGEMKRFEILFAEIEYVLCDQLKLERSQIFYISCKDTHGNIHKVKCNLPENNQ